MESRVTVVGPASWNSLVGLDALPAPRPHTVFARGHTRTLGGTSAGKVLHLADLGIATTFVTAVGDDAEADLVVDALTRDEIELLVRRTPGPTEQHVNLMTDAGERLSIYLAVPEVPDGSWEPAERAVDAAEHVVLDLGAMSLPLVSRFMADDAGTPRRVGGTRPTVWTDLHDWDGVADFHRPFAEIADFIFLNDDGTDDHRALMTRLLNAGATAVVCTLGADGAVALTSEGWFTCPAEPATVIDTNGAGDAFLAGFLAAHLGAAGTRESLRSGARQAVRALESRHLSPLLDRPAESP